MNKIKICFTLLFILFCGAVASFYFYTRTSHIFEVTLSNISSDKSTIGGVLIVHGTDVSLNFLGREFPSEFSEIASLGVSDKFISHIKNLKKQNKKIYKIIKLQDLAAGEKEVVSIDFAPEDSNISVLYKVTKADDTIALIKSYPFYSKNKKNIFSNEFKHFFNLIDTGLYKDGKKTPNTKAFLSTDIKENILTFDLKYKGKQ